MYVGGEIADLAEIGRPSIGVVTAVQAVHLSRIGTLEAVERAKGELVEALPPGGTAVLNADDPIVDRMDRRTAARALRYGFAAHADARVRREAIKLLLDLPAHRDEGLSRGLADADPGITAVALGAALESCPAGVLPLIERMARDPARLSDPLFALTPLNLPSWLCALPVLAQNPPPTLHHTGMLLWADSYSLDLLSEEQRWEGVRRLLALQKADGGWSLATLGDWTRADGKAQDRASSDGYGTGFVLYILRRAGVPSSHAQLRKGVRWLKRHQRRPLDTLV